MVTRIIPILLIAFLFVGITEAAPGTSACDPPSFGIGNRPASVPNEIVVKFKKNLPKDRVKQINQKHATTVLYTSPFAGFKRIKVPPGKTEKQLVKLYNSEPDVEYAELNYYVYALFVPNDPFYSLQWHFNDADAGINIESAWDITTGDPNVIVAVVDTEVAYEDNGGRFGLAPDLANTNFVPGYNFVKNNEHANDDDGHGTHVTGTIAQSTNNGLGVTGIAFNCSIMPIKVLASRGQVASGSHTDIALGIRFAADNGADVINMSLGGPSGSNTLRDAIAYAYNRGVTIVCSAGNEFNTGNAPSYPAAYDEYCIAVGATRYDRTRAPYSTTGSYLDLVAPGGDTTVDQNADGYADGVLQQTFDKNPKDWGYWFYQGTSMAAPHVSAIAALLISTGVTDPNDVREALQNSARDLGPAGLDPEYGWGLVDAAAALNYFNVDVPGDLSGDDIADLNDLALIAAYWLQNEPSVDIAPETPDGIVNFLDFAEWSKNWN